eukprot:m.474922 g.474922  ORF g.474922 m.474922 type:complete len:267 (-) comp20392_c3_seq8:60-860(-)
MTQCWAQEREARPRFEALEDELRAMLADPRLQAEATIHSRSLRQNSMTHTTFNPIRQVSGFAGLSVIPESNTDDPDVVKALRLDCDQIGNAITAESARYSVTGCSSSPRVLPPWGHAAAVNTKCQSEQQPGFATTFLRALKANMGNLPVADPDSASPSTAQSMHSLWSLNFDDFGRKSRASAQSTYDSQPRYSEGSSLAGRSPSPEYFFVGEVLQNAPALSAATSAASQTGRRGVSRHRPKSILRQFASAAGTTGGDSSSDDDDYY